MTKSREKYPSGATALLIILCLTTGCQATIDNVSINLEQRKQLGKLLPLQEKQTLTERAVAIPETLLKTWQKADAKLNPIALSYESYLPTLVEKELLKKSFSTLPSSWQKVLQKKLTRIFFVKNLVGAGITDWVINGKNNERFYTILLNPKLFHTNTKSWLEYRANSMFSQGDYYITYVGVPEIPALTYALLHETAHIIDFETYQTPFVDPFMQQYLHISNTETLFTENVWQAYSQPLITFEFSERKHLNAYHLTIQRDYINNNKLPEIFTHLKQTPFVTLYASLTWAEDYADFAAFSYLEKMGQIPLHLQLKKGKETIVDITPLSSPINQVRLLTILN